jgi:predicted Zn-dependent peptidase
MSFNKTTLESGLKIITEEIPHVRSVALGFWVAVGSRDESNKFNGMSHFLEHLLFKGTKTRTAKEISEIFDTLGGELNAYSAKEYTHFYTRLLDDHVPIGAEVLSDMLQNSLFGEK